MTDTERLKWLDDQVEMYGYVQLFGWADHEGRRTVSVDLRDVDNHDDDPPIADGLGSSLSTAIEACAAALKEKPND